MSCIISFNSVSSFQVEYSTCDVIVLIVYIMAAPFDPTTKDRKEWERLAASKWLPPMIQKVGEKSISQTIPQSDQKQVSRRFCV